MADTVRISIPQGVWTQLASGPLDDCLIVAPRLIYYVYAATAPSPAWDRGYPLLPDEPQNLVVESGQKVFGYSPNSVASAYVTAG